MIDLVNLPRLPFWRILDLLSPSDLNHLTQVDRGLRVRCLDPTYYQARLKVEFGLSLPPTGIQQIFGEVSLFENSSEIPASILKRVVRDPGEFRWNSPELIAYYAERLPEKKGSDWDQITFASRLLGMHGERRLIDQFRRVHGNFILGNFAWGAARRGNRNLVLNLAREQERFSSFWYLAISGAATCNHQDLLEEFSEREPEYLDAASSGAASGGHLDLLKKLIAGGANNFNLILYLAAENEQLEIIRWLLEQGYLKKGILGLELAIELTRKKGDLDLVRRLGEIQ